MTETYTGVYSVRGWGAGIAFRGDGPEMIDDEDTVWSGYQVPTGRIDVHMIGDDTTFHVDPEDLTPIDEDDYCSGCGQIGCTADGRES